MRRTTAGCPSSRRRSRLTTGRSCCGSPATATPTWLPPYVRFDCLTGEHTELNPAPTEAKILGPEEFGDDWSEELDADEFDRVREYFTAMESLSKWLRYVNLRVGGKDYRIDLGRANLDRGVTFEAPRKSLMTAVDLQIFDDLLIGNFVQTTLHGKWPVSGLHPNFTPYVRYADNGRAKSLSELDGYMAEYRRRTGPIDFLRHQVQKTSDERLRSLIRPESRTWKAAREVSTKLKIR